MPGLFDTHCHLDFESFETDFDEVLQRARQAGVAYITTIGAGRGVGTAEGGLKIARAHPTWIKATVGVHPHDAAAFDDRAGAQLQGWAQLQEVVAIGETGLDYFYKHASVEQQVAAFRFQIALAKSCKKPLVIHTRNAADDTLRILREENAQSVGGIMHCFSEGPAFAKQALDLGFVASFSGIVTFKNAEEIRSAALAQPLDALLIETDAPFLAPVPFRGKRNEPAFVAHTARFIAELRGVSLEALTEQTTSNALRIFKMAPQD